MSLEAAARKLIDPNLQVEPGWRDAAFALSLSQIARATAPGKPAPPGWRDVAKLLMDDIERSNRLEGVSTKDLGSLFDDLRKPMPEQRFIAAFRLLHPRRAQQLYAIRHFAESWSYEHRVSDICVSVESKRPLADLKQILDPRKWSQTVPLVWKQSDATERDLRYIDHNAPTGPCVPQHPFPGALQEVAVFGLSPFELARYRNLLDMHIDIDVAARTEPPASIVEPPDCKVPPDDRLEFTYSQYACLKTQLNFAFSAPYGGIDVDCGFGRLEKLGGSGYTRIKARKRARFDQPLSPFNTIYNDIGAVYLKLLIEAFVLYSAIL